MPFQPGSLIARCKHLFGPGLTDPRLPKEELARLVTRMMQEGIVELAAAVE